MFMMNISICKLKGRARDFGYVLESILRVIFSFICQIISSAQKAVVVYQSKDNVFLKMKKIRPQNWIIVVPLNLKFGCNEIRDGSSRLN